MYEIQDKVRDEIIECQICDGKGRISGNVCTHCGGKTKFKFVKTKHTTKSRNIFGKFYLWFRRLWNDEFGIRYEKNQYFI